MSETEESKKKRRSELGHVSNKLGVSDGVDVRLNSIPSMALKTILSTSYVASYVKLSIKLKRLIRLMSAATFGVTIVIVYNSEVSRWR